MIRPLSWGIALFALLVLPGGGSAAEPPSEVVERARQNLLAAKIDEATAELDALLARGDLEVDDRVAAWSLRAQARGATGNYDAVEEDYRAILKLRPSFAPDALATSKKALQRFEAARDALVGTVLLDVRPKDAAVFVDDVEAPSPADGRIPVLAGERRVRLERRGYDTAELAVTVSAAQAVSVHVELVPNARTVVIRTEPEGVRVLLDDLPVGTTERPAGTDPVLRATAPAQLVLDAVPTGEHVFTLEKPCYRAARVREIVSVDVLDPSPKTIGPIVLQSARTPVSLLGLSPADEIRIDGEPVPVSESREVEACVGTRVFEVRAGGRIVWTEAVDVPHAERFDLDVAPRPNAVLVGAARWPGALSGCERAFSTRGTLDLPAGADLISPEGWTRVPLPPDTDLAIAVLPHDGTAGGDRFLLFSPLLGRVVRLTGSPETARPRWTILAAGFRTVDDAGEIVVAEVRAGGPAAGAAIRPGARISRAGGREVGSSEALREILRRADPGAPWTLRVGFPGESERDVRLTPLPSPLVGSFPDGEAARAVHAAWSAAVGASGGPDAAAAWTDLGLLLESEGRGAAALDAWRRAAWPGRRGVGSGTVDYLAGRVLAETGREEEARAALQRALASGARFSDDDGLEIAPAASDRLVDLGVAR